VATNPACLEAIRTLTAVLQDRTILYVLVGGAALQFRYGIIAVRATADIDTVVLVDTWDEYDTLLHDLERRGWKADRQHEYRRHAPGGCVVDLLPYPIREAKEEHQVVLPHSKGTLSTIGWAEALAGCLVRARRHQGRV
jgi:predicted nucleotidyltransferase